MTCPICSGFSLPEDVSFVEKQGKRVILQGRIYAIVSPEDAHYPPFSDYFTATLYPRKGRTKYLKFKNQDELSMCGFVPGNQIRCEGCLHEADGKQIVFDVAQVELL